jgi:hypothetical protein
MTDLRNQDGLQMDNGSPPKWIVEGPQMDSGKIQMGCNETIWIMAVPKWIEVGPKWIMAGPYKDCGNT